MLTAPGRWHLGRKVMGENVPLREGDPDSLNAKAKLETLHPSLSVYPRQLCGVEMFSAGNGSLYWEYFSASILKIPPHSLKIINNKHTVKIPAIQGFSDILSALTHSLGAQQGLLPPPGVPGVLQA